MRVQLFSQGVDIWINKICGGSLQTESRDGQWILLYNEVLYNNDEDNSYGKTFAESVLKMMVVKGSETFDITEYNQLQWLLQNVLEDDRCLQSGFHRSNLRTNILDFFPVKTNWCSTIEYFIL